MPRIIYNLKFDLGRTLTGEIAQLIAPPDSRGQSRHCRPIQKKRVIDLRVGDFLRHRGRSYIIDAIEAYREAGADGFTADPPTEGVRGAGDVAELVKGDGFSDPGITSSKPGKLCRF